MSDFLTLFEQLSKQGPTPEVARDDLDNWYVDNVPTPAQQDYNIEGQPQAQAFPTPDLNYNALLEETYQTPPLATPKETEVYDKVMQNVPRQPEPPQNQYVEAFEDLSTRRERTLTDKFIRNTANALTFFSSGPAGAIFWSPVVEKGIYDLLDKEIPISPEAEFEFEWRPAMIKGHKEVVRSLAQGIELVTRDHFKAPNINDFDMDDPYERFDYTKKLAISMLDDPLVPANAVKQPVNKAFGRLALMDELQPDEDYMKRAADKKGMVKHLETFTGTAPQMAGQIAAHILTGGIGSGVFMALQIAGSEYESIMEANPDMDPERAKWAAFGSAATQAPMEMLSLSMGVMSPVLNKFIKGKYLGFGMNKLFGGALEGFTERLQEIPSVFWQEWAKDPDLIDKIKNGEKDWKDFVETGWEQGREPGWIGFVWGVLLGGGGGKANVKTKKELDAISDSDYDLLVGEQTDIEQLQKKYKGKLDVQSIIEKAQERADQDNQVPPGTGAIPTPQDAQVDIENAEHFGLDYHQLFDDVALTEVDEAGMPIEPAPGLEQAPAYPGQPAQIATTQYKQPVHYSKVKLTNIPVKDWSKALSGQSYKGIIDEDIAPGEKIKLSALKYRGKVYTGKTHFEAMQAIEDANPDIAEEGIGTWSWLEDIEEGFTTNKGNFVDRDQALEIAEAADQIEKDLPDRQKPRGYLVSEALIDEDAEIVDFISKPQKEFAAKVREDVKKKAQASLDAAKKRKFKFEVGDRVTGSTKKAYEITGKAVIRGKSVYMYKSGDESGVFDAVKADKSLKRFEGPKAIDEDVAPGKTVTIGKVALKIDALGEDGTTTPADMLSATIMSGPAKGMTVNIEQKNFKEAAKKRIAEAESVRTKGISTLDQMEDMAPEDLELNDALQEWNKNSDVTHAMFHGTKRGEPGTLTGTQKAFHTFDIEYSDLGAHFGSYDQAAQFLSLPSGASKIEYESVRGKKPLMIPEGIFRDGARLYPVALNIENPLTLVDLGFFDADQVIPQLLNHPDWQSQDDQLRLLDLTDDYNNTNMPSKEVYSLIRNEIQSKGYDGVKYLNLVEGMTVDQRQRVAQAMEAMDQDSKMDSDLIIQEIIDEVDPDEKMTHQEFEDKHMAYIAFHPNQIKSIFNLKPTASNRIDEDAPKKPTKEAAAKAKKRGAELAKKVPVKVAKDLELTRKAKLEDVLVDPKSKLQKALDEFAKAIGKGGQLHFFRSKGDFANSLGIHIEGQVFINENNDAGWYTWSHETVHDMRRNHPDLYKKLVSVLQPTAIKSMLQKLGKQVNDQRKARGHKALKANKIFEEAVAHKLAQEAQDVKFWRKVFKTSFDLFAKLAGSVKDMIALSKPHWRQDMKFFENDEAVNAEIAKVYQEYLERGGKPVKSLDAGISPQTVVAETYNKGKPFASAYAGEMRNILIRPKSVTSGANRSLMVQISSLMTKELAADQGKTYFDKLYSKRTGYNRPADFWEIPDWISRMAYQMDDSDVLIVRNIDDAIELLNGQGYDTVMFSAMDSNVDRIKGFASKYDGQVIVGGYVDAKAFKDNKNVKFVADPAEAAKAMGAEPKTRTQQGL
jgi:flagellar motor protein MotB